MWFCKDKGRVSHRINIGEKHIETCLAPGGKCKEFGQLLGLSKGGYDVSCTSAWTVQLFAQKNIPVVKTLIKLDSHADTCILGDHFVTHDHKRPVNAFEYNHKVVLKYTHIVGIIVSYNEQKK